ncbi:MAG TPA: NUDIX hydrolase [Rhizomicrobium sp.]|jgi:8-oxo-dGTP pyrophosphatase MutT (NUDIX family)|nr:NUDIX hydrolase [Rhizomicrobium sp.]
MATFDSDNEQIVGGALRPKDAATLVIVKRDGGVPRVLMGQRHGNMAFMANKYVFPGGRIDPGDMRLSVTSQLRPHVAARAGHGSTPARARGLALAAIRETFEETGILIGERADHLPRTRAPAWKKFFEHKVLPRLDTLEIIARAVTPPNRTRRFDARFFMVDASAIVHELEELDNEELLTPAWLTLDEARALDLPSITRTVLDEVEARVREGADPSRPIPFYRFSRGKAGLIHI